MPVMNDTAEITVNSVKAPASVRWALASLSLSMLMPSLDTSIANVALPALTQAFTATFQQAQWIVIVYLLAITTSIVSAGRLGDMIGRRRMLLGGISLFTVASLLCGLAPTLWLLVAARALQGIGASVMMALTVALVGETVPNARIGSAMGLLGTVSALGTTLGPSLSGVLIANFGWRVIFLVNLPLGIANLLLARRSLKSGPRETKTVRAGFDLVGTFLIAFTLAAYSLAMTMGRGRFGPLNTTLLVTGICGGAFFVLVEKRAASPLIRLEMLRDRGLGANLAMATLVSTVIMATLVVGPFYLSRALLLDTAMVGVVMSAGPLVAALAGVPAGRLVDRFGTARITAIGLVVMMAGCLTLAMAPMSLGVAGYVCPIVVVTTGYALFQAGNNTGIMARLDPNQRGVVSGMLSLSRNLGLITGASAMGAVFAHASGMVDLAMADPLAVSTGMKITFGVATILTGGAIALRMASTGLDE